MFCSSYVSWDLSSQKIQKNPVADLDIHIPSFDFGDIDLTIKLSEMHFIEMWNNTGSHQKL